MGLEHVGFLWYMRRISPWAALGFAAGMGYMAFMEIGPGSQVVVFKKLVHLPRVWIFFFAYFGFVCYELMNFRVFFLRPWWTCPSGSYALQRMIVP